MPPVAEAIQGVHAPKRNFSEPRFGLKAVLIDGETFPEQFFKLVSDATRELRSIQKLARQHSEIAMRGLVHALASNSEGMWGQRMDPSATAFSQLDPQVTTTILNTYGRNPTFLGIDKNAELSHFLSGTGVKRHRYFLSISIASEAGTITKAPLDMLIERSR